MKIYDDVLDKQFLEYINQTILNMNWQIHYSHPNQKTPLFFNSVILDENVKKEEFIFLINIIFSIIKNEPEIKENNIQLERGYVNLYPYGIAGDWHKDSTTPNGKTILFYPCDWKEEYGGATEFQESEEKVEYKKNRLLIFDGMVEHRSAVHHNPKNRYTVAFKINTNGKRSS
jgi:hypothetical protein